ncbi:NIPSNAP family protein [Chloroflexota bacterium]
MICRIRYAKIRPGLVEDYKKLASAWQVLVHKYGGKVLGFYYDKEKEEAIGIAEYDSLASLNELQKNCEADVAFPNIQKLSNRIVVSVEEQILEKLEV